MTDDRTAQIRRVTNDKGKREEGPPVKVDFNPESLSIVIRNQMEAAKQTRGQRGRPPQQLVSSSEVTLSVQLLFDGTLDGLDARAKTAGIAEMMRPGTAVPKQEGKKRPAVVRFEWANFAFEGIITDYNETVDYFSEEGVPLRSSLNLSITKHEAAFPAPGGGSTDTGAGSIPPTAPVGGGQSVADVANDAGSPDAEALIGAANEVEDIRNPEVEELADPAAAAEAGAAAGAFGSALSGGAFAAAGAGIQFGDPPAAFASGDAGFGLDLGLSAGVSAGAGASLAAGASLGVGAGAGADLSAAAGAVAGVGAAAGGGLELDAFAGLNAGASVSAGAALGGAVSFDLPDPPSLSAGLSLGAGAVVSLGGAAGIGFGAGAGLGGPGGVEIVKVGKEVNLADIIFEEREDS